MPNAVTIYTDGACSGNPGPGGYGTIVMEVDGKGNIHQKELSQGYRLTTNNRMELMSVIIGLEYLENPSIVNIYSDSKYVVDAFNQRWIVSWKRNNWVKSDKKAVKNIDLWERLLAAISKHPNVKFNWVKGHSTNVFNNRCDELAVKATKSDNMIEDSNYKNEGCDNDEVVFGSSYKF